jgi:hypothetical protein
MKGQCFYALPICKSEDPYDEIKITIELETEIHQKETLIVFENIL